MIRRLRVQNFKALRDAEVSFDSRLTVLVGPNGSGKSSVLEALAVIGTAAGNSPKSSAPVSVTPADVSSGKREDELIIRVFVEGYGDFVFPTDLKTKSGPHTPKVPKPLKEAVTPFGKPSFVRNRIAANSMTETSPPDVQPDGFGVPSLMGYLKLSDEERFDEIEALFCQLIRHVKRIRIERVPARANQYGEELRFDTVSGNRVPASAMSDGTLYTLALLILLLGPHRPKLLLLDDLDHRLHPKAQMELVELLHKLLDRFTDLQIVATSHSPYILDRLQPNEVRVTGLVADGSAVVARLEDHPEFDRWKEAMTPGEFWSHMGDDWVKALPPAHPEPVAVAP